MSAFSLPRRPAKASRHRDDKISRKGRADSARRRARLERLVAREMLAGDLGLDPGSDDQPSQALQEQWQPEVVAIAKGLTRLDADGEQPMEDHWLLSWGDEFEPAATYGPSLVTSMEPAPLLDSAYLVQFQQPVDVFDALKHVGQTDDLSLAYPMVPLPMQSRSVPNDEWFVEQWHLLNDGSLSGATAGEDINVSSVWDSYLGDGVVIAIVDEGLEYDHEDLAANYRADLSFDYNGYDDDPFAASPHGTAVAGLISAVENNTVGVSGVAPNSEFAAIRLLADSFTNLTDLQISLALNHSLEDVDIYNNSWGVRDTGGYNPQFAPGPMTAAAIENTVVNGRDGKGAIVVWAAGNGGEFGDDVNFDPFANSRYTIAVGAVDSNGEAPDYTESGSPVLIAAPSGNSLGLMTTDLMDVFGDSTTNYTRNFGIQNSQSDRAGGTSGSAAVVSGVVALMLEANPNLDYRDVQHILVDTARQNNPTDTDWIQNAAGRWTHPKFGFGVVDAQAAVTAAETWVSRGPEYSWTTDQVNVNQRLSTIPNASVPVKVTENFQVENIELKLDLEDVDPNNTTDITSLEVIVTSPRGTQTVLKPLSTRGTGDLTFDHTFVSNKLWDEWTFGDWSIDFNFANPGEVNLSSYELSLFGNEIQADLPLLSVSNTSAAEDQLLMNFVVSIPEAYGEDIEFKVYTMEDTALATTADADYEQADGTLFTIPAGETSVVVPITLYDNGVEEPDETFWLALSEPVNARVPLHAVVGTIVNDDFATTVDANPWEFLSPAGSLVARSLGSQVEIEDDADVSFLRFEGQEGNRISFLAMPTNPDATIEVSLIDPEGIVTGPFTAGAPGGRIQIEGDMLPVTGNYLLETRSDDFTQVDFELYLNSEIEMWDGDLPSNATMPLDSTLFADEPGRYAVVGRVDEQPILSEISVDDDAFVDISGTGTPLNLDDDGVAQIVTTVGNVMMPAGLVRISNNGVIVAGRFGIPSYVNGRIPNDDHETFLSPFWDDLAATQGEVYWEEVNINGIPALVVQWDDLKHFNAPTGSGVTFQAQIFQEGTGDVLARFVYEDIEFELASLDNGRSATVGYQVEEDIRFEEVSFNSTFLGQDNDGNDENTITFRSQNDIDRYRLNLADFVDRDIDVIVAPVNGTDLSAAQVTLIGPTGAAGVASSTPAGIGVTNYALGIPNVQVAAGTYEIEVNSFSAGEYLLLVTRSGSFDTEPNNDQEALLRKLSETTGAIGYLADATADTPDEVDFFEFELSNNDRVILETMTPNDVPGFSYSNQLDPMLEIYDQKGDLVASDTSSAADSKNAYIRFNARNFGTYRVAMRAESGSGVYFLKTSEWLNVPPEEIFVTPNRISENTDTSGGPVLIGQLTSEDPDAGDTHEYELVSGFGDIDNGSFTIVGDQLFVNQGVELDFETQSEYRIRVRSTDDYGDAVERRLSVFVTNRAEIESITVGTGDQHSRVDSLTIQFDSIVAINPGAFEAFKRGDDGGPLDVSYTSFDDGTNRTVAVVTFGGSFFADGSLMDGNYQLNINDFRIRDSTGEIFDGDADGIAGGDYFFGDDEADAFYRLFGDIDSNRTVNFDDFFAFRDAFGSAVGDSNYEYGFDGDDDDVIDFDDFFLLRSNFGSSLDFE